MTEFQAAVSAHGGAIADLSYGLPKANLITTVLKQFIRVATSTPAILSAVCGLTVLGWENVETRSAIDTSTLQAIRATELRGSIAYSDELLTMSARVAASTGERRWIVRYNQAEPLLDAAIEEAVALATPDIAAKLRRTTTNANRRLVQIERASFAKVAAGQRNEAWQMLNSQEYSSLKAAYAAGMQTFGDSLQAATTMRAAELRRRGWLVLAALIMTGAAFLFTAYLAKRGHRHLQIALQKTIAATREAIDAEAESRAANDRYRLVAEATGDIIWDFDIPTGIVTWNAAIATRFGHQLESSCVDKLWWIRHIHPDDRARVVACSSEIHAGADGVVRWTIEYRFARADGSYATVLDRGKLIRNAASVPIRTIGAMVDLSEKRRTDDLLQLGDERLRLAVAASGIGISDFDVRTDILHWSDELRAIIGVDAREAASQSTAHALIHPDDQPEAAERERLALAGDFGHLYRGVVRIFRKNDGAMRWVATQGNPIYDRMGNVVRVLVTARDITEEKSAQDRINWAATHDALTSLPNRAAFRSSLDSAFATAEADGEALVLLLINVDNFKEVNDSLGYQAGDLVLRTFGDRIGAVLPRGGLLARFGGDEFAVLLPGIALDAAIALTNVLQANFHHAFTLNDGSVHLRASVGIAAFLQHASDAEELLTCAGIAVYAAKAAGGSTARVFEPTMRATLQEHTSMLQRARHAVENAWVRPFYQPKISLETGRVTGLEALFRWDDPIMGVQSPATIAHAFDDTELAAVLGEAMVEAVLGDIRYWLDTGIETGRVAINASAAEFRDPRYAERLLARLKAHRVPASALELELTETAFLHDQDHLVSRALETLRAAGITIALDDFGTGFSSLSHLRQFPVDTLKIDQSFVARMENCPNDRAIVEVILRLGDALDLTVVAEGVETETQATSLRRSGCTVVQGYLFAKPMPAALVADYVATATRGARTTKQAGKTLRPARSIAPETRAASRHPV